MYNPEQPIFDVQPASTIKPIIGIDEKWDFNNTLKGSLASVDVVADRKSVV